MDISLKILYFLALVGAVLLFYKATLFLMGRQVTPRFECVYNGSKLVFFTVFLIASIIGHGYAILSATLKIWFWDMFFTSSIIFVILVFLRLGLHYTDFYKFNKNTRRSFVFNIIFCILYGFLGAGVFYSILFF